MLQYQQHTNAHTCSDIL